MLIVLVNEHNLSKAVEIPTCQLLFDCRPRKRCPFGCHLRKISIELDCLHSPYFAPASICAEVLTIPNKLATPSFVLWPNASKRCCSKDQQIHIWTWLCYHNRQHICISSSMQKRITFAIATMCVCPSIIIVVVRRPPWMVSFGMQVQPVDCIRRDSQASLSLVAFITTQERPLLCTASDLHGQRWITHRSEGPYGIYSLDGDPFPLRPSIHKVRGHSCSVFIDVIALSDTRGMNKYHS